MIPDQADVRDLGNGLILRQATGADVDRVAALNAQVLRPPDMDRPNEDVAATTRDLMVEGHPTCQARDFTLVEDTTTGAVVSSLCLIPQTWSYDGIEFPVGRPELVATHPDYRRRGLVAAQFDLIHRWSDQRGQKMQAISGIPWFYRQFGYEMALDVGGGGRWSTARAPKLSEGQAEPYSLRPATAADVPFIAQVYEQFARPWLVTCVRSRAVWDYELLGRHRDSGVRSDWHVVESLSGEPVGFLAHSAKLRPWEPTFVVTAYELTAGASWWAVTPSVLRYLQHAAAAYAERDHCDTSGELNLWWLGPEHPVYQAFPRTLPATRLPYSWYVRIPDLPGFLRHIAPVLEERIAQSVCVGYSGQLRVSLYRDGFILVFENGRLAEAEPWVPTLSDTVSATFPGLTFLQLLLGYRSLEEMQHAFADCRIRSEEAQMLMQILFPKHPSHVWAIG